MTRVISAIIKHPAEAKEFSLDYVLLLLGAVEQLCWAKGHNPKISLKAAGITDNPLCSEQEVAYVNCFMLPSQRCLEGTYLWDCEAK